MEQLNKYTVRELGVDSINILSESDQALIGSYRLGSADFLPNKHTVDLSIYDLNGRYVETFRNIKSYSIIGTLQNGEESKTITVNPVQDVLDKGYLGDVQVTYEVFNNLYSPSVALDASSSLFVADISTDRTEIRAKSTTQTNSQLRNYTNQVYNRLNSRSYFSEIYLDFIDEGLKAVGVNVVTEVVDGEQFVTFKLYEPLPSNVQLKSRFAVLERVGEPVRFEVIREVEVLESPKDVLRGPNFNVDQNKAAASATDYFNYSDLFGLPAKKSRFEEYSLYEDNSAQISIDHEKFSDFIHFSSAAERLENFRYKLGLIESCEASASFLSASNPGDPNIQRYEETKIGIISNFDHYDRYLYFESASCAWPKLDSSRPYKNVSVQETMPVGDRSGSIQKWWENLLEEATNYDETNVNLLVNSVPRAIAENADNEAYLMFVHMIGQHFDNEWIYAKALTERYSGDNRLDKGLSKDLVYDAIASFGLSLSKTNQNLEELFNACNVDGSYSLGKEVIDEFIRITLSLDTDADIDAEDAAATEIRRAIDGGFAPEEVITSIIDGEFADRDNNFQPIDIDDYRKEVYKRIYHNIPLLVKAKGTTRGLRALINCFGIPDDVLEINVLGGTTGSFGPQEGTTSSIDKIRLDNEGNWAPLLITSGGTVITSSVLSKDVSQHSREHKYFDDLNEVEVGFGINKQVDEAFKAKLSGQPIYADIVGDPRNTAENYGTAYRDLRRDTLHEIYTENSSSLPFRSPTAIIRLVRYFDSMLFRSLQDFLPARSSVSSGAIIKNPVLARNRYRGVKATADQKLVESGTIDTGYITGSHGGSFDFLPAGQSSVEVDSKVVLFDLPTTNYSKKWSTPLTTGSKVIFDESPRFNGELSGSEYVVSDGEVLKRNMVDGKLVDGNPYIHAGSTNLVYKLSYKFLTLPAPASCNLLTIGNFIGTRYKIKINNSEVLTSNYSNYPRWFCSYGDIYEGNSPTSSDILRIDGGMASTTVFTSGTVDAGHAAIPRGSSTLYDGTGGTNNSILLLDGALHTTALIPPNSGSAIFLGWYKGDIAGNNKNGLLEDFVNTSNALSILSGSTTETYTARYSQKNEAVKVFGVRKITTSSTYQNNYLELNIYLEDNPPIGLYDVVVGVRTSTGKYFETLPQRNLTTHFFKKYVSASLQAGEKLTPGIVSFRSGSVTVNKDFNVKYFYSNGSLYNIKWL